MSHIWMCAHSCSLSLSLSLPVALSPCRSFSLSFSLPFALSPFRSLSLSLSLSTHWVGDDLMRIDSVALQWNIECVLEFVKFRFILGAQGAAVCTACIALVVIGRLVECQTKITCWICDIQMRYWCGGAEVQQCVLRLHCVGADWTTRWVSNYNDLLNLWYSDALLVRGCSSVYCAGVELMIIWCLIEFVIIWWLIEFVTSHEILSVNEYVTARWLFRATDAAVRTALVITWRLNEFVTLHAILSVHEFCDSDDFFVHRVQECK